MAVCKGGEWYIPLYDANGNITEYVNTNGVVVARYDYDAFGRTVSMYGTMANDFKYRFSTKYYDDETGFYYYGYRYYYPEWGRWINRDPIEERGGMNLYGFVYNSPMTYFDILGEKCCVLIWDSNLMNGDPGHMALKCDNAPYISKYPKGSDRLLPQKPDWKTPNNEKSGTPTEICFDCVDESKVKEWFNQNEGKNYFWGNASCIEAVFDALIAGLYNEYQDKPYCRPCEGYEVSDEDNLRRGGPTITPDNLVKKVRNFQESNCNRYSCKYTKKK